MLFGAAGQVASMAILCGVNSTQNSVSIMMQACAVVSAFLLASFKTASSVDLMALSAGLPLRLQHLRRQLAGHDLALPRRNRPSPNPCTRKRLVSSPDPLSARENEFSRLRAVPR
jgi:hypothetical protein